MDKLRIACLAAFVAVLLAAGPVAASTVKFHASGGPVYHRVGYFTLRRFQSLEVDISMTDSKTCAGGVTFAHSTLLFDHSDTPGTETESFDGTLSAGRYKVVIQTDCAHWDVQIIRV